MKDLYRAALAGFCLSAFALISSPVRAQVTDLFDPLGLRASCASATKAAPQDPAAWLDPAKIAADAQAFLRRSISATVVLEVSRCNDKGACVGLKNNGTGTVVSDDGLVLTAFHVVKDTIAVRATFRDVDADGYLVVTSREVGATVVAVAPKADVALLRLEPSLEPYPHMQIECLWQADKRTPVWHFGQRSGWGFGRVTFKTTLAVDIAGVYETDAKAQLGDSGGPFVRSTGALIGILLSINGGKTYYMPVMDAIAALEKAEDAKK